MKISNIETLPISYPLEEGAFDSTAKWSEFNLLMVKVYTDDGFIGVSDIAPLHGREMKIFEKIILDKLAPKVVGENPFDREKIWVKMVGFGSEAYALGRSGAIITASSAIDVALWDIVGKSLNTPVYNLFGGRARDSVELYASFMGQPPVERIKDILREGFMGVKVKVGFNVKKDVEYLKRLRDELGYDFKLIVDGNQGYSLEEAKDFARRAEELEILWFEEPVNVYNFKGLNVLSKTVRIPLALGENYYMINEFLQVIEDGTARIIQPDVNHAGGLTQMKKISSIAEAYDVKLAPHLHSLVGFVVGLHVLMAQANGFIAEYPVYGKKWTFRDKFIEKCVIIKDGFCQLSCKNGIGIELDESYIKDYIVED